MPQQTGTTGQQQTQQPVMMEPPKVITTKDHLYLKDAMSWMLVAMKKAHHFSQECSDPELKQALDQVGRIHERHYGILLTHLQNNNTAEMNKVRQIMQ